MNLPPKLFRMIFIFPDRCLRHRPALALAQAARLNCFAGLHSKARGKLQQLVLRFRASPIQNRKGIQLRHFRFCRHRQAQGEINRKARPETIRERRECLHGIPWSGHPAAMRVWTPVTIRPSENLDWWFDPEMGQFSIGFRTSFGSRRTLDSVET